MPIVDSRRKGRVLNFGGEKGRGRGWIGWKEANELERLSVGAVASNAIVLSNGFVVDERSRSQVLRSCEGLKESHSRVPLER